MSIGERIKQGRLMAGMSQRKLAELAGVSAQAISKYERDIDVPGSRVLISLSRALNVKVEFFLRPKKVTRIAPSFRAHCSLPAKQEAAALARITDWLEKYLEIESILSPEGVTLEFKYPEGFPRQVSSMLDIEQAAVDLRTSWDLGSDSIENLTSLLEDRGIKVGIIDAHDDFDACTFQAEDDGHITVIITRDDVPGDRQRFSIAHELGHLMLKTEGALDPERAANRFAGAFLVPEDVARFELRENRKALSSYELHMLKHKYGLSMQAWVYRARDLGILSGPRAAALFKKFRALGWHKKEPGESVSPEIPSRFERLVMSALADGIISEKRAEEFLSKPVDAFLSEKATDHGAWLAEVCN